MGTEGHSADQDIKLGLSAFEMHGHVKSSRFEEKTHV